MNKSQELAVMLLRAKMNVQELLKQHQNSWYGQEPKVVKEVKDARVYRKEERL